MYATVQKWGNSHAIRIPKPIIDQLRLKENESVEILASGEEIIIRKERAHRSFEERMLGFEGDYDFGEMDSGASVGREVF